MAILKLASAAGRDIVSALKMTPNVAMLAWIDMEDRYRRSALGPLWMALTLGAEGARLLFRKGTDIQVFSAREAAPVQVLDTVGAGDSFLAGLLACALHHADAQNAATDLKSWATQASDSTLQDVLCHALASATLVVMRRGCDPARWDEVRARMQAFPAV